MTRPNTLPFLPGNLRRRPCVGQRGRCDVDRLAEQSPFGAYNQMAALMRPSERK